MLIKSERRSNSYIYSYLLVRTMYHVLKRPLFGCMMRCVRPLTGPRFADRFGRKTSFYLAWLWLVVVSDSLGGDSAGTGSWNELISLGLRFPQHGQEPVCLGEPKSFLSTYGSIVSIRAEFALGPRKALQWRRYRRPPVSMPTIKRLSLPRY